MGFFDKLFNSFKKSSKDVEGQLDEAAKIVMEKAGEFKDIAAEKMEDMAPMVDKAKETLSEKLGEAGEVLGDVKDKATAKFEEFSNNAEQDAKETAEKGDNLEEMMENNHLEALKNTKLTGDHKGQPIEDAVNERIDAMKNQSTETVEEVTNDYDQDLVLPDLPETPTTTESSVSEAIEAPSDKTEGLIEAPDTEEITDKVEAIKDGVTDKVDAVKDGVTDKVDAVKDGVADKVDAMKDGVADKVDVAKEKIAGVGAGIAGVAVVAGGLGENLKDKAAAALGDAKDSLPSTEDITDKVGSITESVSEKMADAKDSIADSVELPSTEGVTSQLGAVKESMDEKIQETKDGLADKVDAAKEKIAGVGAGIAGGLSGGDLKDKAEAILGDTTAKLDETLEKAKDLGGTLEDQANAIKEKHLKSAESMDAEIIEEVEAVEVTPEEKDPNEEPSFSDLVDDAKDALFGLKDSIDKKID